MKIPLNSYNEKKALSQAENLLTSESIVKVEKKRTLISRKMINKDLSYLYDNIDDN